MQNQKEFDVVIVGAGTTGAIIAKELTQQCEGIDILILEAGTGSTSDFGDYELYNDQFFNALAKTPNSPYTDSEFAPSPSVLDIQKIQKGTPSTKGYFVQEGPFPFLSNYNRNVGGTTLHWLGTCLRMCPNDFRMKTKYKRGVDWPLTYEELKPYYRRAEFELGVSADVEDQNILGITFNKDYVYPMKKIPQSYLDQYMIERLEGLMVEDDGVTYPFQLVSTPQARNGMPNPKYKDVDNITISTGYTPVGAVGAPELGQRCEGNSNCTPICPVQAKYNAIKSLDAALNSPTCNVTVINQAPVSHVEVDLRTRKISKIHYKTYEYQADGTRANIQSHYVKGRIVVLAAHAIENAKILLASDICKKSGQVGKNLMDHLCLLTWGTFPDDIGAYRGPGSTSGMGNLRDGSFRENRSAFRVEIGNWGWNWPKNTPESTMMDAVDGGMYGRKLRDHIMHDTRRQSRIAWEVEQLPSDKNYITICEKYKDDLGNYRPVIHYHLNDYEKKAALFARGVSKKVYKHLDVKDETGYDNIESNAGYFKYEYEEKEEKKTFEGVFNGAGHVVGCHRMGTKAENSVVDSYQRAHEHENLYVAGCGSFPTLATSNPTLTMSALAYRTADSIVTDLQLKN